MDERGRRPVLAQTGLRTTVVLPVIDERKRKEKGASRLLTKKTPVISLPFQRQRALFGTAATEKERPRGRSTGKKKGKRKPTNGRG